ncbi:MAG: NAD(P)H-hydrate dehydratase [Cyanothece sp. SIO1E1]|nr:NAD(P)H-hydrate dehydratase [Cyanothece sp. SIO1E1]
MVCCQSRLAYIQTLWVTAAQMRAIESRVFAAGMPVAALMEKVAGLVARQIQGLYPRGRFPKVGILVGPGHNGGDGAVIARELYFSGYEVLLHHPFSRSKELTAQHVQYAISLGMPGCKQIESLQHCDLLIDGLFGFGLERSLTHDLAATVEHLNQGSQPILSIDLPSGLHTDTGAILGAAIRATHTFCLGLWKLAFAQEQALPYLGVSELIDFDLPVADIQAVLGNALPYQRITATMAIAHLPLPRPVTTHKYQIGHLLLICGSRRYLGAALLAGLGARASGVGMLSIAVPESLKPMLAAQLPDALILGCPENEAGAIAHLPAGLDLSAYQAIACGPGLTKAAKLVVQAVLASDRPLLLDADGLNILAELGPIKALSSRMAPTVLTPHLGEFKRLFPDQADACGQDRLAAVRTVAQRSRGIVLLKGARVAIANAEGTIWINPESTPALARGGSGDVLSGLLGGLMAQATSTPTTSTHSAVTAMAQAAAWWHAQAGQLAAQERTELGVDACTLTQYLMPALQSQIALLEEY